MLSDFKEHFVTSKFKADYGLLDTNSTYGSKVFGILSAGHKVFVSDVKDEVAMDDQRMVAYGLTILPWNNKKVKFAYAWGSVWVLWRAPWEPENTPDRRGPPKNNYPPHFDYDLFKPPADAPKWGLNPCGSSATNGVPKSGAGGGSRVEDAPRVGDAPRVPDAPK